MTDRKQSLLDRVRRTLIGAPIHTAQAHHEKLTPFLGLPVFSSDALSSVAYATEAILSILVLKSQRALGLQFPITLAICVLIVMIGISYTQTIYAYPKGGGSYIVASDNLGETPGLLAGAALMIDYILTVAVSISAGVAALVSAVPQFHPYLVEISVVLVIVVAWLNLRGVRESGVVFAFPTYGFILGILTVIAVGLFRAWQHPLSGPQQVLSNQLGKEVGLLPLFLLLRSFAAGCTALTGIEAVSDGVQSFKEPASRNARIVLQWMTVLLLAMFIGIGYLSQHIPVLTLYTNQNPNYRTVTSQIAAFAFGDKSIGFYYVQFATMAILVLAANTAFADFPRVASFLARDGFLPRPFARQGDRLVFHNGIIVLGLAAAALVFIFGGELDHLLPLYAIGVFTAFSLSQLGMVYHWKKLKTPGWQRSITINVIGFALTSAVAVIILATKFLEGAWIAVLLILVVFYLFKTVKNRYRSMSAQLALTGDYVPKEPTKHTSMLLMPRVHRGIVKALMYAKSMDPNTVALHVTLDERTLPQVRRDWERYGQGVPLVVLNSPFRSLIRPVLQYVDELLEQDPDQMLTVVVAEAVSTKWHQKLLHENVAAQLKAALAQRKNVAVTSVRYFLE